MTMNQPSQPKTTPYLDTSTKNSDRTMCYHQNREAQDKKRFGTLYTPCSGLSVFHDLRCGHRVQSTSISESCGINCIKKTSHAPFMCPDCMVADVRLEMIFENINLSNNSNDDTEMIDDDPNREQQIRVIANAEIRKRVAQGYRICKVTKKCEDPRMQFFNQFLEEEGFGDMDEVAPTPSRSFKRPMQGDWRQKKINWELREPKANSEQGGDPALNSKAKHMERDWQELQAKFKVKTGLEAPTIESLAEEMGHSHIDEQQEDDAMMAVRDALGMLALGSGS